MEKYVLLRFWKTSADVLKDRIEENTAGYADEEEPLKEILNEITTKYLKDV